ncbi:hypothetical protein F5Y18DRAFT_424367 [Xylariaceae sp. FL1019]|nr:hypothetical protein F5Y18DRAFT_424367 [Xylariaceae sp. FL1019]
MAPLKHSNTFSSLPLPVKQPSAISPPKAKPKSRGARSVLSNITASLSRASLSRTSLVLEPRRTSTSSKAVSAKSMESLAAPTPPPLSPSITANPRFITTGQPSEYWTGRFMALQDRFQSETMLPRNLDTLAYANSPSRSMPPPPGIPRSSTMNSFIPFKNKTRTSSAKIGTRKEPTTDTGASLLLDEDNRTRRVFVHLEAMCMTAEARESLHAWQQGYAVRNGKEYLFTEGRRREKSWVGRFLGDKH